jgi:ferredoxin
MPIVSIKDTSKTYDIPEGDILYNGLSNHGEILPHGCLAGSCGACRVEIIEGKENLRPPGVIESNTVSAIKEELSISRGPESVNCMEIRLSCRAQIIGDVCIKPIK